MTDSFVYTLFRSDLYVLMTVLGRLVVSALVLLFGLWIARKVTHAVRKAWNSLLQQEIIISSPVGSIFESDSLRGSGLLTQITYWSVVFLFTALAGELLGITLFARIIEMILAYIPNVLSAAIVFILGIVAAGVGENVVKQQVKPLLPEQAVLVGTLTSSAILTMFGLIALSELGIASQFILVLFSGFVFAAALAIGISVGFGSKDLMADALGTLVKKEEQKRQRSKKDAESSSKKTKKN